MSLKDTMRRVGRGGQRVVVLLDIGTAKTCCMIFAIPSDAGRPGGDGRTTARLLGVANTRSAGIKAGVIVDMDEAEKAVRTCVGRAERMAGVDASRVIVSVSCGRLKSANFTARTKVEGGLIGPADVARLMGAARRFAEQDGRTALHFSTLGFEIDGNGGIEDPRGLGGRALGADMHVVTADQAPLEDLHHLMQRCYLDVEGLVPSPYASALSVLTEDEARLGVACIDLGAGTTTLSVFCGGQFVFTDAFAMGGGHITYDIARRFSTPLADAERIKTLYGTLVVAPSDVHDTITVPVVGDENEIELGQTNRGAVRQVVEARVTEILDLAARRLADSGFEPFAGDRVVITGGGAQLTGLAAHAAQVLGRKVRIGGPRGAQAVPENLRDPAFAVVHGLLQARVQPRSWGVSGQELAVGAEPKGYIGRVGQWFRENFWDDETERLTGT